MNSISFKLPKEEIEKLIQKYQDCLIDPPNEHMLAFIKTPDDTTISIYKTDKVLIQGTSAHIYGASFLHKDTDQAGSDEVGTGDYFGPVCVCACIVRQNDIEYLESLGVNDSKKMDDEKIIKIGQELYERLENSLLILDDKTYNRAHERYNLNEIKARLHNQAYINLIHKGHKIPKACYVDQFEEKEIYFRHLKDEKEVFHDLHFETKAESSYIAVAAASVIARWAFLKTMQELSKHYDIDFPFGSRAQVDEAGLVFVKRYGFERLKEVAKIHFKNTERIKELLNK